MDADVIIVGAGAAGLAAALALGERGVHALVLEARDRTGGRVHSERLGTAGVPVELGAEFIHGAAPETSAFMREAGLRSVPAGETSFVCDASGVLRADDDDFSTVPIFARLRDEDGDLSVADFLARFDADPALRVEAERARSFVEGFEAADPALASARAIAAELRSGVDETSARPTGSYAPLMERITARGIAAGADLRLGANVKRIAWNAGGVTVAGRTADGATFEVRARCALLTLPLGVLRAAPDTPSVSFEPPLSARKQSAIAGLEMGHVVRVALAFRTPFWETAGGGRYRDAAFFRCERGPFNAFWTQAPLRGRTIVAWAGGPRANAFDGMSEQQRIERARDEFGAMLGLRDRARSEFEAGATHDWANDPLARGAYSYVLTGAGTARVALGESVHDALFFAGEATVTDGQAGTVSGAFASGLRAAREIAALLNLPHAPSSAAS